MSEFVWVADWEMQCCGDAFRVGDLVNWHLSPADVEEWLENLFARRPQPDVTMFYDHHSENPPPRRHGVVRSIQAVHCCYQRTGRTLIPVRGSAVTMARSSATGWEEEDDDDTYRFVAYIVELDEVAT